MKIIVSLLCWLLTAFCVWFPFAYFHSDMDKKEVRISNILVDTEEEALEIKQLIADGKSFEEMAQERSTCESREQKGDIGYNERGRLLPEFEKAAFKLKKRVVSDPVQTEVGWHLIKIYDIKYYSDRENFEHINYKNL